jgi:hypothetical protein
VHPLLFLPLHLYLAAIENVQNRAARGAELIASVVSETRITRDLLAGLYQ